MISAGQQGLIDKLQEGIDTAKKYSQQVLVSHVMPVKVNDPLDLFRSGEPFCHGRRIFWQDSSGMTIVAIGSVFESIKNGEGRYDAVKSDWERLMTFAKSDAVINGTGPMMIGGFSFNTRSMPVEEWASFPDAGFTCPHYMLTVKDGEAWLTMNQIVCQHDDAFEMAEILRKKSEQWLESHLPTSSFVTWRLTDKEPLHTEAWLEAVRTATDRMKDGALKKIVLSRVLTATADHPLDPTTMLSRLRAHESNCTVFAFERDGDCFIGATPERLVKRDGQVFYVDSLAGTAPRGRDGREDEALGSALLNDAKNRAEHQYVVQMIKETLGTFCESVKALERPRLLKNKNVQHLHTPITGLGRVGASLFDAVKWLHPTPAMGGTPTDEALRLIRQLESHERGWYASPIGWIDQSGNGDFAVAIRSALVQDKRARLYSGCGVVADSDPLDEYRETDMKFRPILNVLEGMAK
ncbi:isochorismate synthase MenF [Camelliibacillus cellulosilyticus]|uniref:isochorismate synthase n=1 Tax=Camelliibacillus cellulosilyticus TaxID=2174486 RepID=A0ABV9GSI8_9BACL